ncbi:MAG: DNA repair protein RecN, partial [Opitutales bacterium]|nr:DNA repair protein RecN [Opitutales bacterium]
GLLAAYQAKYQTWRALLAERERLALETKLAPDQIEFLQNQLARIDALDLSAGAVETLERDFARMSRAQELATLAAALAEGLTGDEGVQPRVAQLLREGRALEAIDAASQPLVARLASAAVELDDLGAEVQGDLEGTLAKLEQQITAALRVARQDAAALRAAREQAAKALAKVAAKGIAQLGFQKADFQIRLRPAAELGPMGDGGAEFLFSPNVGEAPLPLNRVASSGELARVMLALKTVLADLDAVPLLVFDEVDANVGGEIGRVVGEKMAAIAHGHQVLCVTHLPQVAAQATCHLVVTKDQSQDRAVVAIEPIQASRKARVGELARMLGDSKGKSARAHAEELLGPG